MNRQLELFCHKCGNVLTHANGESSCAICPEHGMARQLELFCRKCGNVLTHRRGESYCETCIRPEGIIVNKGCNPQS